MLGELLLATTQPRDALREFEAAMAKEPGRYRSLAGAMSAADQSGDAAKAKKYASQLLQLAKSASPGRPEIDKARQLIR